MPDKEVAFKLEWILPIAYVLAFLANAAASVFWGVRYKRANDELLAAKDAQIDTLRELTSTKVLEHFRDTKAMLEDSIRAKEDQIRALEDDHISRTQLIDQFQRMRDSLQVELEISEENFKREIRRATLAKRIDDLEVPLDIQKVENIITEAGLSDADARTIISSIVVLPKDWSRDRVVSFLVESITSIEDRERALVKRIRTGFQEER